MSTRQQRASIRRNAERSARSATHSTGAAPSFDAPKHRAEAQNNGNVTHQVADTRGKRERNLLERHPRRHAQPHRSHGESECRMQPHACNQYEKQQHCPSGTRH